MQLGPRGKLCILQLGRAANREAIVLYGLIKVTERSALKPNARLACALTSAEREICEVDFMRRTASIGRPLKASACARIVRK